MANDAISQVEFVVFADVAELCAGIAD